MAYFITNSQIHGYSLVRSVSLGCFCKYFFSFFFISQVFAQHKTSPKALRLYQSAERLLPFDSKQALALYQQVVEVDSNFAAPYMRIGQILSHELDKENEVLRYFKRAVALDSNEIAFSNIYKILGEHYLREGSYQIAQKYLEDYLRLHPNASNATSRSIKRSLKQSLFAQKEWEKTRASVQNSPLPVFLNAKLHQSYPVMTADLTSLIFTINNGDEDIVISERTTSGWTSPVSISTNINSSQNEGTCAISADGRMLIFTACDRSDGYGKCDLYETRKTGTQWSTPRNLGKVINSPHWESQPSLSADGHTLYFSSDRPGGQGGKDIWVSEADAEGFWQIPQNLGSLINTEFDEISPFIHTNNVSLFFSSDGREGMGGFDVFVSKKIKANWSQPAHFGYPLNDHAHQIGFYISPDCQEMLYSYQYHATQRTYQNLPQTVICRTPLPDSLVAWCPVVMFIKGMVRDGQTSEPLGARVTIQSIHDSSNQVSNYTSDDSTGKFLFVYPKNVKVNVSIEKEGYYPLHWELELDSLLKSASPSLDVVLWKWEQNRSIRIKNILFLNNKTDLDSTSSGELKQLADYLLKYPYLKIQIEGHTDDVGQQDKNMDLSLRRALTVVDYLQQAGVMPTRLQAKGFGSTKPLVENISDENRRQNRRVEWRIID